MNKPAQVLEETSSAPLAQAARPGKVNNFDLIRLLAALQVVFHHTLNNMGLSKNYVEAGILHNIIAYFPGVPIFFTISGFLVYWSFERNRNQIRKYFKNRALRIFPALWACVLVSVVLIFIFNPLDASAFFKKDLWLYLFCQSTMFQTYFTGLSPVFGNGIPNGSLWTITIELQFYFVIPVIYYLCSRNADRRTENTRLLLLFAVVFAVTTYARTLVLSSMEGQIMYSWVIPYLFNFLVGIMLFKNFDKIEKYVHNKFWYWLAAYVVYCITAGEMAGLYLPAYWPDFYGLVATFLLAMVVISAAYTRPRLSHDLLRGNDISYGVYIYHLLVINSLLLLDIPLNGWIFIPVLTLTVLLAWLSWVFIEKKALQYKWR